MDELQFERWRDMAQRLARVYPRRSRKFRAWLEVEVTDFIACLEPERANFVDWDQGPVYVCDRMDSYRDGLIPRAPRHEDLRTGWGPTAAYTRWEERWADPLSACVRAALDMASKPSAGVLVFTMGDLRRAYPEGVPDWLADELVADDGTPLGEADDKEMLWM